jgi:murein DD-endopeptidase MepM/ murein hydrolase activator NlpD
MKRKFCVFVLGTAIATLSGTAIFSESSSAETFSVGGYALNTNNNIRKYDTRPEVLTWERRDSDPDQNFARISLGGNLYLLKNNTTGGCLNAHYHSVGARTNTWSPCNNNDADMKWRLNVQSDGSLLMNLDGTSLCLDTPVRANYGLVHLQQCSSTNGNQKWSSSLSSNPLPAKYYDSLASWSDTTWENAINSGAAITTINDNPNLDHAKVYRDLSNDLFGKFFRIGGAYISDDYYRETLGKYGYHGAIDISATSGTPVKTLVSGKVVLADMRWGLLTIQDAKGNNHIYMHLSKFLVSKGQSVSAGQVVANTGSTGATNAHLHYEITRAAYPYGSLQTPAAKTKDEFRARTFNPLKDYWLMRRGG